MPFFWKANNKLVTEVASVVTNGAIELIFVLLPTYDIVH